MFAIEGKKIWVAGHRGMVGSAIVRRLDGENCDIITAGRETLDLADQAAVRSWVAETKPDAIIVAAAKVGGILANSKYPADFLYENLVLETNIIEAAHRADINRLLFLGSSCIYPKFANQPIDENALLTGPLEPTNLWYAIAKIAGIKLCEAYRLQHGRDYISAMPTNLYGIGDNFDLQSSHVLPALIRKAHDAKTAGHENIEIWGSGTPLREFMHADDCADACVFLLQNYSDALHMNIGYGEDITIRDLAQTICKIVGFKGELVFDSSKPDGTPRKLMDSARINALGWNPKIGLEAGITSTYDYYLQNIA